MLMLKCSLILALSVLLLPQVHAVSAAAAISPPAFSLSHYVSFRDATTTAAVLSNWGKLDASHEDPAGDRAKCTGHYYGTSLVTILDFGEPAPSAGVYGVYNWQGVFSPFTSVANFVYDYALSWFNNAGVCAHLTVALGINNSGECAPTFASACLAQEGYAFANAVQLAETHVRQAGIPDFAAQVNIEGGDDIEDGPGFDTYHQTYALVKGFISYPTLYTLYDYGDALPCGNMCDNGNTTSWDDGEFYNLAWALGGDQPLPEAYALPYFARDWAQVYRATMNGHCGDCVGNAGTMKFAGVMSDDGANDQATGFWNAMGGVPSLKLDTCMPSLASSESGKGAPCS